MSLAIDQFWDRVMVQCGLCHYGIDSKTIRPMPLPSRLIDLSVLCDRCNALGNETLSEQYIQFLIGADKTVLLQFFTEGHMGARYIEGNAIDLNPVDIASLIWQRRDGETA